MRKAALLFVIAVYAYAAKAQFTLRPQFGFESPVTKISYNNSPYYKTVSQAAAQAGVRADYQFKKGLAPFVGIVTHRPLLSYSFDDPKTGMTSYNATAGDLQVQLQGGLQYNIKPITLSKKTSTVKTETQNVPQAKSHCYHSCMGGCYRKSNEAQKPKQQTNTVTMRLQPLAGIGYVPSGKQNIEINSGTPASYVYNAGNVKTEFITGMGFEFAKNSKRFLTLSVNYFKGLATNETVLTTESGGKTLNTNLSSKLSGWNASIGIPISFAKKSTTKTMTNATTKTQSNNHHNCEYYRSRCGGYRRI